MSEGNGKYELNRDIPPVGMSVAPRAMIDLPPSVHEEVKTALRPALKHWCENVVHGVMRGERTAMNLWGKAMGVVGADVEINLALIATKELGVGSLDEAKRLVNMARSVEGIDEDGAIAVMEEAVRAWWAKRGKRVVILADSEAAA